ncbi:UNVERIFIED_CONTAM: putative prolyl 4-hydroxylase 12 [Sesamum angustifolium]|uniref:Prolyl 4-hydroxylase 12 n=1 Tax=Sesamum angustifolium TaxID=2727405 RepID=A0AAW2PSL3_9LAMI
MATKVRVFLYRNFLSDEECDYLISWVHRKKSHNMQVDDLPKSDHVDTDDEIARNIEEIISAWTFLPKENSKSLQVLHFGPEDSKQKYNYFQNKAAEEVGEPLLATVILYLSNVSQGGQILFPHSENRVWSDCTKSSRILRPSRGNAIVFFSSNLNATPTRVVSMPDAPSLRVTCDDNCPRWAATGECQRNPVFMVGSPDYYGHVGRAAMHALCDSYSHVYSCPPIMSFPSVSQWKENGYVSYCYISPVSCQLLFTWLAKQHIHFYLYGNKNLCIDMYIAGEKQALD